MVFWSYFLSRCSFANKCLCWRQKCDNTQKRFRSLHALQLSPFVHSRCFSWLPQVMLPHPKSVTGPGFCFVLIELPTDPHLLDKQRYMKNMLGAPPRPCESYQCRQGHVTTTESQQLHLRTRTFDFCVGLRIQKHTFLFRDLLTFDDLIGCLLEMILKISFSLCCSFPDNIHLF